MEFRKKGALFVPIKSFMLKTVGRLSSTVMYTKNDKKYLDLILDQDALSKVKEVHKDASQHFKSSSKLIDPLVGGSLTFKVPWKYDRVMCNVTGSKTIQELVIGNEVSVTLEFCGVWNVNNFCGPSWKLVDLMYQPSL